MTGHPNDEETGTATVRRSPLAMAVLLLLAVEPKHPYGLRQRIVEWDKDRVINVSQRNAIYQTMRRLERDGLIAVHETAKHEKRPERTVFRTTERGVQVSKEWVRDMLRVPAVEYPEFPAALAFIASISRSDAVAVLRERLETCERSLAGFETEIDARVAEFDEVDPIHLVDADYQRAMASAEITWLRGTIEKLEADRLNGFADGA
ncbi:PadR family transcriptional regulator [Amycolatopsis azurea]|uniref:Transcriptional regulator, PadR family n=2 Tax=Amycolatopsis azurea DSM 43854 TaxID=1238180 RepID=M2QUP1_9PSEU|nr:PadR family transcriptional regulator [Amycolatopsis azurea]EMD30231.1 Transcriptional regulator, PadR family [Amycolatopsis azurea DSM 43854]